MKKSMYQSAILWVLLALFGCSQPQNDQAETTGEDTIVQAEEEASQQLASPLETASGTINGVKVEMQYGSPGVKGREIWGDLVAYDKVWRTGANEATWVSFDKDVKINGESLPAGKYGLFTIPSAEGEWTVIFNKEWDQWGAYDYKEEEDALRVKVTPMKTDSMTERMTFTVDDKISFMWENMAFALEVEPSDA